ncbi:hypothetical protein [Lysinibacillus tabacifolii]|uniref:MerR family transcriptional regulator n=1 Tax=Lysinibacillus tabacifolii TaxID=1173107 RepID=A0ABY2T2P5_9BACI|nr:hypothetical protein [Lysinibacillus tabacifolii]TKI50295.1 hypothetical protein FC748_03510 [Lysinibacillus tabacifolii]
MDETKQYYTPKEIAEKSDYKVDTIRRIAALFEEHNRHFSKQGSRGRVYDDYALASFLLYKSRVEEIGERDAIRFALKVIYSINIDR